MSDTLHHKKTRTLTQPTGISYLIGRLDHALNRRMLEVLAPIGLTVSQYTALSFLHSQNPISNAQLAERTLISPQSANEMIKQMVDKGLVQRMPDPDHGRVLILNVTDAGQQLLSQAHAKIAQVEAEMLENFNQAQKKVLSSNLRQLLASLGKIGE